MVMQVGRNAARVIPVLTESKETVCVERPLWSRPQPLLPVDVQISCRVRPGAGIDRPVPIALRIVAAIRTLASHHFAQHSGMNRFPNLVPAIPGCALH